jgi:hypothetical protein
MDTTIESISALEILDSRGNPTVEAEIYHALKSVLKEKGRLTLIGDDLLDWFGHRNDPGSRDVPLRRLADGHLPVDHLFPPTLLKHLTKLNLMLSY